MTQKAKFNPKTFRYECPVCGSHGFTDKGDMYNKPYFTCVKDHGCFEVE